MSGTVTQQWRCAQQAIQAWRDNSGFGRVQLVKQYFLCVEGVLLAGSLMCCS
jgi:hypothetical protein